MTAETTSVRWRFTRTVAIGTAVAAAIVPFALSSTEHTPPTVKQLVNDLKAMSVQCAGYRRQPPRSQLQREYGACRDLALATFSSASARRTWVNGAKASPWFPARYLVVGANWAVWMWRPGLARAVHAALGGKLTGSHARVAVPWPVITSCDARPPRSNCPDPAPARPIPRGPSGPVYSFASKLWAASATNTRGGIVGVTGTNHGTSALTGVLQDGRRRTPPLDPPLAGVRVFLRSTDPSSHTVLTTVSDHDGSFAFIDIPAGSCYVLETLPSRGIGRSRYASFYERGGTYEVTQEIFATDEATADPPCSNPSGPSR